VERLIARVMATAPARLAVAYGESGAGNYAAGIAFNAFFTMFPLILGLLAILGFVVRNDWLEQQVRVTLINLFPVDDHKPLESALTGLKHNAYTLGMLSIAGLLWSGTGLFSSMEFALNQVYGLRGRDPVRVRLMGLGMIGVFVVAIVAAVAANWAIALLPEVPYLGFALGGLVLVGLVAAIYFVVPNRSVRLAEIWPGAIVAGLSIEVLTLAFPLYGEITHSFSSYGRGFALMFLLATWLYLLSQLVMIGAVLNRMLSRQVPKLQQVPTVSGAKDAERRGVEA
jgi:membrane protein